MAFCFSGRSCCSSLFLNETFSVCHVSFCCSVWQQVYYDASPATTVIFWCNDSCTDHTASAEKDQNRAFLGKCHTFQFSVRVRRFDVKTCQEFVLGAEDDVAVVSYCFYGLSTTQAEKPVVLYNRGRNSAYKREIKQTCHDFISLDLNESVNCWLFVYLCSVSVCLNMLLFIFSLIISCDSDSLMRVYSIHTH